MKLVEFPSVFPSNLRFSGGHHGSPVNDSLPGKEVQLEALSIAQVAELQHRLSDGAAITASHAMSPMKIHRKGSFTSLF